MEANFNFYDFIGILIPGTLFSSMLFLLIIGFLKITLPIGLDTISETLLFILIGYFCGYVIKAVVDSYQSYFGIFKKFFSEELLTDDNKTFSESFKNLLWEGINSVFLIKINPDDDEDIKKKKYHEISRLCKSLIEQENIDKSYKVFLGLFTLYRGLFFTYLFGIVVTVSIIAKFGIEGNFSLYEIRQIPEFSLFLISCILLCFFILTIKPIFDSITKFDEYVGKSIYEIFLTWYCSRKKSVVK